MGNSLFTVNNVYNFESGVNNSCIELKIWQGDPTDGGDNDVQFEGLIAQSVTAGAKRTPQMIYEIGSMNYYVIDSKPSGGGQIKNILGPATSTLQALKDLGDICKPSNVQFKIKDCACSSGGTEKKEKTKDVYTFVGGFLTGVTLAATADSFAVVGQWDFMFQDVQVG